MSHELPAGTSMIGALGGYSTVIAVFVDRAYTILDFSTGAERASGWTRDEVVGKNLASDFSWAFADGSGALVRDRLRAAAHTQARVRVTRKDGRPSELDVHLTPVPEGVGHAAGWLLEARDVTEEVALARRLQCSEERYRSVVSAMAEGVVMQGADGQILTCNPAAESILGLTRAQMEGRTSLDPRWQAIHEDGSPFPGETHPAMVALRTGRPVANAIMGVHKPDGGLTWISINAEPLRHSPAEPPFAVVATFANITAVLEEKRLLAEREAELLAFFKTPAFGMTVIDASDRIVRVNATFCAYLGYSEQELIGRTFSEITHPDDRQLHLTVVGELCDGQRESFALDKRYLKKDGSVLWASVAVGRIAVGADKDFARLAIVRDISLRKRAEDQVRRERDFSQQLIHAMSDGVAVLDADGHVTFANPALAHMLELPLDEIVGRLADDFIAPGERAEIARARLSLSAGPSERILQRPDGSSLDVTITLRRLSDDGRVIATLTDITWQKATEARLRELVDENERVLAELRDTEATLRRERDFMSVVMETMADGLTVTDESGMLEYVNPAFARMVGRPVEEVLGHGPTEFATEEALPALQAARAARLRGVTSVYESQVRRSDGEILNVLVTGAPHLVDGRLAGVIAVVKDVTRLKRAEQALTHSEHKFRSLFENLREEVTVFDVVRDGNGGVVDWVIRETNTAAKAAAGGADLRGRRLVDAFGGADVRWLIENTDRILAGELPRQDLYFSPVGRWYSSTAFGIDQRTIVSVASDITVRREMEDSLKKELARNEQLVAELTEALQQVKTLRGYLPICSHCKKVRDDAGYWEQIEAYVSLHTDATFSHGICPECLAKVFPDCVDEEGK